VGEERALRGLQADCQAQTERRRGYPALNR
jgi:hypothetical protein